ncbi:MAG: hypothetical protein A2846_03305 [Candidatus Doudnabacteria bacterium RIFCSPHIGHO2_01_FULL_49_9]|uniref:ABC transporter ATP-binding protein n=1 Tax=Candidatus Doudnabacteria bacterium RIFCSPHIGHO2_01_FULL_49_9 TaxID=1817827 RepID=A0A1F5NYE5_9BACT|nr:MAG: hypothetical protein A2846_03305 [Candidatus Doudnabacteria bacterium RIFCSPHIGHO2_01_FULL_49_9]
MAILVSKRRLREIVSLSRQAYGEYKTQILALTGLGFVAGILEGVGITAVIPLFSFIIGGQGATGDWLSGQIRNFFELIHLNFSVKYLLIFIAALFLLKIPVMVWISHMRAKITTDYEDRTKNRIFAATVNASWQFLLRQKSGHLETILLVDAAQAASMLAEISTALMILSGFLIYFFVAVNVSLAVTLLTLGLGGAILVFSKPLFQRVRQTAMVRANLSKELAHHVSENIYGIKSLKASQGLPGVMRKSAAIFSAIKKQEIRLVLFKSISRAMMQPVAVIFILGLFAYSYKMGNVNVAMIGVVVFLIDRIFLYFQQLQGAIHTVNNAVPHLRSIVEYEQEALDNPEEAKQGSDSFAFRETLEFRGVSFGYSADRTVLQGVSFAVRKGETLGIIGPSGTGKTTIVDLILRLLQPQDGEILLDGKNISEIKLAEWRKNIGYVSQDMFLMNDTIASNIRFYDDSVSLADVADAARMADIYDFIDECPDKFDTVIGDRGLMLSAGQRQRIVIARVLARKPQILILDEATSALDAESESRIQKVIHNLRGKMTVVAIAHRLSTVMDSDRLVVLEDGRVAEEGDPRALLKDKDSYFFKVYNLREAEQIS